MSILGHILVNDLKIFLNVYNFKYGLNNKYPINKIDISKELDFINAHIDD